MSPRHRRRLSWSCLCGGIRRVKNFLFWTTTQSEFKTLVFHGTPETGTAAVRLLCSTLVSAAAIHSQTNTSDFLAFRFSSPTQLVQRRPQAFLPPPPHPLADQYSVTSVNASLWPDVAIFCDHYYCLREYDEPDIGLLKAVAGKQKSGLLTDMISVWWRPIPLCPSRLRL